MAEGEGDDGDPLVIGHDLGAAQAQALAAVFDRAACPARVLLVSLCLPGPADASDAATHMAYVLRQWGTRVVRRALEAGPWGQPSWPGGTCRPNLDHVLSPVSVEHLSLLVMRLPTCIRFNL